MDNMLVHVTADLETIRTACAIVDLEAMSAHGTTSDWGAALTEEFALVLFLSGVGTARLEEVCCEKPSQPWLKGAN